jgi:hypothetical protein
MKQKKGVLNQIVSIFIIFLVVSILIGFSFLFIAGWKQTAGTATAVSGSTTNENGFINGTSWDLNASSKEGWALVQMINATNGTSGALINTANYTVDSVTGIVTNLTGQTWNNVNFTYTWTYFGSTAYKAINQTETSGYQMVNYLGIIFLALIFGAILAVILRIIIPYINLGQQQNQF